MIGALKGAISVREKMQYAMSNPYGCSLEHGSQSRGLIPTERWKMAYIIYLIK